MKRLLIILLLSLTLMPVHANTEQKTDNESSIADMLKEHFTQDSHEERPHLLISINHVRKPFTYPINESEKVVEIIAMLSINSKLPQQLRNLSLYWQPDRRFVDLPIELLQQITPALYRHKKRTTPLPIEESFLSTGSWDPVKRIVTFPVSEKIAGINRYFITFTYPKRVQQFIRNGRLSYTEYAPLDTDEIKTEEKKSSPEETEEESTEKKDEA